MRRLKGEKVRKMEEHDTAIFGRKIFFVKPPFNIENFVLPSLQDLEYEAFIIPSYKYAKSLLKLFPTAICFFNIDEELSVDQWINFLMSFQTDPVLSKVIIGAYSSAVRKLDKNKFLLNTNLPAGFITYSVATEEFKQNIISVLNINGAKGQRKYIRADCSTSSSIAAQCSIGGVVYPMKLLDISSVGLSCIVPAAAMKYIQVNSVIRDVIISLFLKKIRVSCAVIMIKEKNGKSILVMLFTKGMPEAAKKSIREYIRSYGQSLIGDFFVPSQEDNQDYSTMPEECKPKELPQNVTEQLPILQEPDEGDVLNESTFKTSDIETTSLF